LIFASDPGSARRIILRLQSIDQEAPDLAFEAGALADPRLPLGEVVEQLL